MENKQESTRQTLEDYASDKYVVISTRLGYRAEDVNDGVRDYELLARIMGIEEQKVRAQYKGNDREGQEGYGIVLKRNVAEMLSCISELEDALVIMLPERGSEELVNHFAESLRHKKIHAAYHRNAGYGQGDLTWALSRYEPITKIYSHTFSTPVFKAFTTLLRNLADKGVVETEDYRSLVETICAKKKSSIDEVTPREE